MRARIITLELNCILGIIYSGGKTSSAGETDVVEMRDLQSVHFPRAGVCLRNNLSSEPLIHQTQIMAFHSTAAKALNASQEEQTSHFRRMKGRVVYQVIKIMVEANTSKALADYSVRSLMKNYEKKQYLLCLSAFSSLQWLPPKNIHLNYAKLGLILIFTQAEMCQICSPTPLIYSEDHFPSIRKPPQSDSKKQSIALNALV